MQINVNIDYPRLDQSLTAEEQVVQLYKGICQLIDTLNILLPKIGGD